MGQRGVGAEFHAVVRRRRYIPRVADRTNWSVAQLVLAARERSRLFTKSARESRGNEKLLLRTESTIARTGKAKTTSEIRNKQLKNPVRAVRPALAVTMKISGSRPVYTDSGAARGLRKKLDLIRRASAL